MAGQQESGRVQQKNRTRRELLVAARELLEQGRTPTIPDVADHAGISRATAYRYYSSIDTLTQEAVLDGLADGISAISGSGGGDLAGRVEQLVDRVLDYVLANEALFRAYLRNVVAAEDRPSRGARRVAWLDAAYGVDSSRLSRQMLRRLTGALSLITGIEGVVVAKDVCRYDDDETRALFRWIAAAVLRAALQPDADSPAAGDPAAFKSG